MRSRIAGRGWRLSAQIANAAPDAHDCAQKEDSITQAVAAGDVIKWCHTTTNGGDYTAKHVIAQVWLRPLGLQEGLWRRKDHRVPRGT